MAARSSRRFCFFSLALLDFLYSEQQQKKKKREFSLNLSYFNKYQSSAHQQQNSFAQKLIIIKFHKDKNKQVGGEEWGLPQNPCKKVIWG